MKETPEQRSQSQHRRPRLDRIQEYWALLDEQDALNVRLNFLRATGRTTTCLRSDNLMETVPTRSERWDVVQEEALIMDRLHAIAQRMQEIAPAHGWSQPRPGNTEPSGA